MSEVKKGQIMRYSAEVAEKTGIEVKAAAEGLHSLPEMRAFVEKYAPAPCGHWSSISLCATCRWAEEAWDQDSPGEIELQRRYPLACTRASMSDGKPNTPETLAFTMDGSDFHGELLVTPDFGCVMWEAKEA